MASLAWAKEPGLLPPVFNGWATNQQSVKSGADPVAADAADFAVLKEYGFTDFETAFYVRNGRKMQVKAARFNDASGAFGAFTFYVQPQMQAEKIGDRGASNNSRILFFRGNILVDVSLEQVTAMSAADLRALADALPQPHGNISVLPALPGNLPQQSILPKSQPDADWISHAADCSGAIARLASSLLARRALLLQAHWTHPGCSGGQRF